jgi:hypothetical protein
MLHKYAVETRTVEVSFHTKLGADEVLLPVPTAVASDPALVVAVLGFTSDTRGVRVRVSGGLAGGRYTVEVQVFSTHADRLVESVDVEVAP